MTVLLYRLRYNLILGIVASIERAFDSVNMDPKSFTLSMDICMSCSGSVPRGYCHQGCNNKTTRPAYCDKNCRTARLLSALKSARLWPLTADLGGSAVAAQDKLMVIPQVLKDHSGDHQCPVLEVWRGLGETAKNTSSDLRGLDINLGNDHAQ